jgi:hypothetical protein
MRKDQVMRRKLSTQLFRRLQQSFIIRNKYLDVIANLSYFSGRSDKVRNRTGRPVPNVNGKSFPPQISGYAATNNPEPDYTDVSARSMGHRLRSSIESSAHHQIAEKTSVRQWRNCDPGQYRRGSAKNASTLLF